jgi:hypothetical protein
MMKNAKVFKVTLEFGFFEPWISCMTRGTGSSYLWKLQRNSKVFKLVFLGKF